MTQLEELYDTAYQENIEIENSNLSFFDRKSIYLSLGQCQIAIMIDYNCLNNRSEEKVVLSHELGHHFTSVPRSQISSNLSDNLRKSRNEYKAVAWSIRELIPVDKLIAAFENDIIEVWELAEYFDTTYEFTKKAISYYKVKYPEVFTKVS